MDLTDHRQDYEALGIDYDAMHPDPLEQFRIWFHEASVSDPEPHAMVLSTVDQAGRPHGRNVLLRGVDSGFVFYTNYGSDKARALDATAVAALTFRWYEVHRQVHVEGTVARIDAADSDAYFAKRPRESQLGAWASRQSTPIDARSVLLDELARLDEEYQGSTVPRPPFWGGYRVDPERIEFWQGQPNRLHDRLVYLRDGDGWRTVLLSP